MDDHAASLSVTAKSNMESSGIKSLSAQSTAPYGGTGLKADWVVDKRELHE
jgi:hypothetical protein